MRSDSTRSWLQSDHDPSDTARYADQCGIRNFITTIGHFITNTVIVKSSNHRKYLLEHDMSFANSLYIFNYVTHIHIPDKYGMSKPSCIVSNTVCVHWTGHDTLVSALKNDVATPPIVTSWLDIISVTFFIQSRARNFNSKFPSEWFMSWFNWQ